MKPVKGAESPWYESCKDTLCMRISYTLFAPFCMWKSTLYTHGTLRNQSDGSLFIYLLLKELFFVGIHWWSSQRRLLAFRTIPRLLQRQFINILHLFALTSTNYMIQWCVVGFYSIWLKKREKEKPGLSYFQAYKLANTVFKFSGIFLHGNYKYKFPMWLFYMKNVWVSNSDILLFSTFTFFVTFGEIFLAIWQPFKP